MVYAIMKNGNNLEIKSKLGVAVLSKHPNFKQFRNNKGQFTSVSNASKSINLYNKKAIVISA